MQMDVTHFLLQTAIIGAGGTITVFVAYLLIRNDIQTYFRFRSLSENKEKQSALLPLQLQAYERMIIFVERINPANLLVRLHEQGITVGELQASVLQEIRAEFQHNITQQLYIQSVSWNILRKLKDDTIAMVNNVVQSLPAESTGLELSKQVLNHMSAIEENPYDLTINQLKSDIQKMF